MEAAISGFQCAFPLNRSPGIAPSNAGRVSLLKPFSSRNVSFRSSERSEREDGGGISRSRGPLLDREQANYEVSPHRADLLNEVGGGSGERAMGYVERTLGFRTQSLDDREIRLVTDIVGGVVRWKRYLDHLISSLCTDDRMFRNMEPLLLQILRIGFYEIIKLDNPVHAVVFENVQLAKIALRPGAGNLVNGLLRKLISCMEKNTLPLPKIEGDDRARARALAIIHSHPVWMVRRWQKYFGPEETAKLMKWNNTEPTFSIRVNSASGFTRDDLIARLESLKVPFEVSDNMGDFVRIKTGLQAIIQDGLMKEGLCSVQDESAGMVVSLLDPQPGETIIDCCSAPGGKALYMAALLRGQGSVHAIDVNKGRLRILEEAARSQKVDDVIVPVHADLRSFAESYTEKSDKVLLDAPCSGLGVLSKRADLRWNRKSEDMEELKNLQDELLDAAASLVKPGGVLVYSTCSIDPEENEDRVLAFLSRNPVFGVDSAARFVPSSFVSDKNFYYSNPAKHSLDGAFAARLVRRQSCD
ncbi:NOL1/NOP2/sun family protein / antitermination NusB domain-containing protein isoform X2 [Wolffia australiana]